MLSNKKVQRNYIKTIQRKFDTWTNSTNHLVAEKEVYAFLDSIKGTSFSMEMNQLFGECEKVLSFLSKDSDNQLTAHEVRKSLQDIFVCLDTYQYQLEQSSLEEQLELKEKNLILIVDDNFSVLQYLKFHLESKGFFVLATVHGDQAIRYWYDLQPDCVILDVFLPGKSGFEVLSSLQKQDREFLTPVIMISAKNSKENRIQAYLNGADDFLAKPIDIEELTVRIKSLIQKRKHLEKSKMFDVLTGAFNRQFLEQMLVHRYDELKRHGNHFSIAFLDLDHFKHVNDQYGHVMGDVVLKKFVEIIHREKRKQDYLMRYGGEEFIMLFPNATASEAAKGVERLRQKFIQHVFTTEHNNFKVTFSAGVVEVNHTNSSLEEWIQKADQYLYQAKNKGRNQVVFQESRFEDLEQEAIYIGVIDDNKMTRKIISDSLHEDLPFHLNVKEFSNGEEFLLDSWHREGKKYIIILDNNMPIKEGKEVLINLRENYDWSTYKIIMLTADTSETDIAQALEIGADDYMTKPFSTIELMARIKRLLKAPKR